MIIDLAGLDPWQREMSAWRVVRDAEFFNRVYSLLLWNRVRGAPSDLVMPIRHI